MVNVNGRLMTHPSHITPIAYRDVGDFDPYFDSLGQNESGQGRKTLTTTENLPINSNIHVHWANHQGRKNVEESKGLIAESMSDIDDILTEDNEDFGHTNTRIPSPRNDLSPSFESMSSSIKKRKNLPLDGIVNAYPFSRNRPLAKPYCLPQKSEYGYRGQLLRAKGKWKRKWSREHFIIEHNILLTCTKEEPFLVKVCIPLRNIQSVEPLKTKAQKPGELGRFFEIKYIQAARKGKEKFAIMHCQATTAAEAEQWIVTLKRFKDRAMSPAAALVDYVVRENAEAAIYQLHDAMKNSGLYQTVSRLCSAFNTEETDRMKEAFWKLKQHQIVAKQKKEKKEFEKGLAKADEDVRIAKEAGAVVEAAAKRLLRLGILLQKLSMLVNSKRHLALMLLKRKVDLQYTEKTANDVQEVMINTLMIEHSIAARRQLEWRRNRIVLAVEAPFKRLMKEALVTIEAQGHVIQTLKRIRRNAMLNLFRSKELEERQTLTIAVMRWKVTTTLKQRQEEAIKALLLSRRRWDLHLALRRWNAGCIIRNQKDIRACRTLEGMMSRYKQRILSIAFRSWARFASEDEQLEALQIAANFNLVNDHIVSGFDRVPMERACHLFALAFKKMVLSRFAFGIYSIRTAAMRNKNRLRNYEIGCSMLAKAHRSRLHHSFIALVKFAFRCHYAASNRLIGVMQLTVALRLLVKRKKFDALISWRRNIERSSDRLAPLHRLVSPELVGNPRAIAAARIGDVASHIRFSHLMLAMSILRTNSREIDFLRSIARFQGIERICYTASCQRIAAMAFAFCRFSCNLNRPSIPSPLNELSTVVVGEEEFLTDSSDDLEQHRRYFTSRDPIPVKSFLPRGSHSNGRRHSLDVKSNNLQHEQSLARKFSFDANNPHEQSLARKFSFDASNRHEQSLARKFSFDASNRRSSLSIPVADAMSGGRVTGLISQLLARGVNMTRTSVNRPQVLLQGHSTPQKIESGTTTSFRILQSPTTSKSQWKHSGHHCTIRNLLIKKNALPSHTYTRIKPKYFHRIYGPKKFPSPLAHRYRSFGSSDIRFTNDSNRISSESIDLCQYPYNNELSSFLDKYYDEGFDPNDPYRSPTVSQSLQLVEPLLLDEPENIPINSQISIIHDKTFNTNPHLLSYRYIHHSNELCSSPRIDRPISPTASGGKINLNTPILGQNLSSQISITPTSQSNVLRLSHRHSSSPLIHETDIPTSSIPAVARDGHCDSICTRIEEWLRSSQHCSRNTLSRPLNQSYLNQSYLNQNSLESNIRLQPEFARPSYLDLLLASSRESYPQTATGGTPEIELQNFRVFDDDRIRSFENCISTMDSSMTHRQCHHNSDPVAIRDEPSISAMSIDDFYFHGKQRPDRYSTNEETSVDCNTTRLNSYQEAFENNHEVNESPLNSRKNKNELSSTTAQQKAYRAHVVPIANDFNGNDSCSELSIASSSRLTSTQLLIVRGETGGPGGAGDIAVIATDIPKHRHPSKKKSQFSSSCNQSPSSSFEKPTRSNGKVEGKSTRASILSQQNRIPNPSLGTLAPQAIVKPVNRHITRKVVREVSLGIPITRALVHSIANPNRETYHDQKTYNPMQIQQSANPMSQTIDITRYSGVKVSRTTQAS